MTTTTTTTREREDALRWKLHRCNLAFEAALASFESTSLSDWPAKRAAWAHVERAHARFERAANALAALLDAR